MDLLQNIVSESFHQQEAFSQLASSQSYWVNFKSHTQSVLEGNISELSKTRDTWFRVQKQARFLMPMFTNYYMHQLDNFLNSKFRKRLQNASTLDQLFLVMFNFYDINEKFLLILERKDLVSALLQKISSILTALKAKQQFNDAFYSTFRKNCLTITMEDIIEFEEVIKDYIQERCRVQTPNSIDIKSLRNCIEILSQMNMLEEYFEAPIYNFNKECEQFVKKCTQPEENQTFLQKTLNYYRTFQRSFIRKFQSVNRSESGSILNKKLEKIINQLDNNPYFICAKHCASKILDIVLNFPESQLIIQELKICIDKSHLLGQVSEKLIMGIQKRLLIPGVITQTILNQYINMLKVLQIIDPHGLSFEKITNPIKSYLLNRNDTLRCIISHLTEDGDNYFSGKEGIPMVRIPSIKEVADDVSSGSDQDQAKDWQVLPVNENKNKTKKLVKYQKIDLVNVLINLYGSQQAFINEYQNMLAEKLMSAKDYNIDEEIKNIELLKMRFGQTALQNCNIIVKDVNDSRKNDKMIHRQASKSNTEITLQQLHCLAVSKGYWPINYEVNTNFHLPTAFKALFQQYAGQYSKIKAMRKINWHYNLGHVNLTLTFDNGPFEFKCLPVHAIMITYFDNDKMKNKDGVTSQELSNQLNIPHHIVKQKMSFWVHKQVVKETRMPRAGISLRRLNSMEDADVISYRPVDTYVAVPREDLDDDPDIMPMKEGSAMESHLRHIIEGLIISILNINGPKSPQKIHLLLKTVYKTDLDYTYGEVQTQQILKKMTQRKKIFLNGDVYSIRPGNS